MSEMISHDAWHQQAEGLARRALGLNAAWWMAVGVGATIGGRGVGRAVGLPAPMVRAIGVGAAAWGGGVAVGALAEEWQRATRHALAVNVVGTAAIAGHAIARGTRSGKRGLAMMTVPMLGFAAAQAKALVAAEPRVGQVD